MPNEQQPAPNDDPAPSAERSESQRSSDASLIIRFQAGEDDAATSLYTRYAERLLKLADRNTGDDLSARIDAEDIVQSVFRTFFRRVSDGHYQIPEGEELWKLLLVIALNKVRVTAVHHRAIKRDVSHTKSLGDADIVQSAPSLVLRLTIEEVLATLPPTHHQVIRDRIDGREISEIAARGVLSRRSIERILQSFRGRLRKSLDIK